MTKVTERDAPRKHRRLRVSHIIRYLQQGFSPSQITAMGAPARSPSALSAGTSATPSSSCSADDSDSQPAASPSTWPHLQDRSGAPSPPRPASPSFISDLDVSSVQSDGHDDHDDHDDDSCPLPPSTGGSHHSHSPTPSPPRRGTLPDSTATTTATANTTRTCPAIMVQWHGVDLLLNDPSHMKFAELVGILQDSWILPSQYRHRVASNIVLKFTILTETSEDFHMWRKRGGMCYTGRNAVAVYDDKSWAAFLGDLQVVGSMGVEMVGVHVTY